MIRVLALLLASTVGTLTAATIPVSGSLETSLEFWDDFLIQVDSRVSFGGSLGNVSVFVGGPFNGFGYQHSKENIGPATATINDITTHIFEYVLGEYGHVTLYDNEYNVLASVNIRAFLGNTRTFFPFGNHLNYRVQVNQSSIHPTPEPTTFGIASAAMLTGIGMLGFRAQRSASRSK